jgi:hypothetical protein
VGYVLRGVIGPSSLLRATFPEEPVVELRQNFALIALDERQGAQPVGMFHGLTADLRERLERASRSARIAYVEAEFFGGRGTQSGIAWADGVVLLGPLHTQSHDGEDAGYSTSDDLAINQVLRVLGVTTTENRDEFSSLGLERFRVPTEWRGAASHPADT